MVYLITGDNAYRVEQELATIADGLPLRRISGDDMSLDSLQDVLVGQSLFVTNEVVVLSHLADNTLLWEKLGEWIPSVDENRRIVIVETKPDKRTKAYKAIVSHAAHITADLWTDRQQANAREWLIRAARERHMALSDKQVVAMVERAMVPAERPGSMMIDQMRLISALMSLQQLEKVDDEAIATVMPAPAGESVFRLLELAIERHADEVRAALDDVRRHEEAHRVFALLASQWYQFVAVATVGVESASDAACVNSYVAQKFNRLSRQCTKSELRHLTRLCADIDAGMKLSQFSPWDGIERFLMGVALRP